MNWLTNREPIDKSLNRSAKPWIERQTRVSIEIFPLIRRRLYRCRSVHGVTFRLIRVNQIYTLRVYYPAVLRKNAGWVFRIIPNFLAWDYVLSLRHEKWRPRGGVESGKRLGLLFKGWNSCLLAHSKDPGSPEPTKSEALTWLRPLAARPVNRHFQGFFKRILLGYIL